MLRIPVDFNTIGRDDEGRVWINTSYFADLKQALRPGMKARLYEDGNFEVDAIVSFDDADGWWYGTPDWSTRRDYDLTGEREGLSG